MKEFLQSPAFKIGLTIVAMWMMITSTTQRIKDPKLTETELFLLLPENFILQFDEQ